MKHLKRTLFLLLLCTISLALRAEEKIPNNEIWYTSSDGNVFIPNKAAVFGATIKNNTYENGKGVITFDGPVTSIGKDAFSIINNISYSNMLTSVTIPASVTSIGDWAFNINRLTSVTFAEGSQLTSIGVRALSACGFTSIVLPNTVTSIGQEAFFGSSLTSINIPSSVTSIGDGAFQDCTSLKDVTVNWTEESDIPTIDTSVFSGVDLPNATLHYPDDTQSLYENADGWKLFGVPMDFNKIWFTGTSDINRDLFSNINFGSDVLMMQYEYNDGQGVVTFNNNVTAFEEYAFYQRSGLTSITIPSSVEKIGEGAFYYCTGLTDVYVNWTEESDIPTIDATVFENVNLSNATLHTPPGTASLYKTATVWSGFGSIKAPTNEIWYTSSDGNVIIPNRTNVFGATITSNTYSNGKGVITFSDDVTSIGQDAFKECATLTSITIPNSVESIGDGAFCACEELTSITIPSSVTSIGENAFYECEVLTSIILPSSVTSIGQGAFFACEELTSITIPSSVTSIGEYAFGYSSLASISFAEGSLLTSIGKNAFYACSMLSSITFPSSLTSIGEHTFADCSELTNVDFPNSVTSIGQQAFEGCSSLTGIILPNSVTSIGDGAFYGCTNLQSVTFESLPSVGSSAFGKCALSNVILDLTDSEKPYSGTSLYGYPEIGFTEANYTRSSAPNKWGTIVLPFVPENTTELEIYALSSMTTADGGSLTFTKVETIAAGVPYLFRNVSENADFTLTKTSPDASDFVLEPQDQEPVNGFTMKGSFLQVQLDGATNTNLYYLSNDQFWHANGKINIAPFRAYIEGGSGIGVKSFVLMIEDEGTVNAIPGILTEDGNIDETEGIYDLSGRKLDAPRKGQVNIIRTKGGKTIKRMF